MPLNRADVYTRAQESGRPRCRPTDCNFVFDGRLKACQQVGLFPNCHVINHTRCLVFCCRRSYGNNRKIESRSSNANATRRKRLSWLHFFVSCTLHCSSCNGKHASGGQRYHARADWNVCVLSKTTASTSAHKVPMAAPQSYLPVSTYSPCRFYPASAVRVMPLVF